MSKKPSKSFWEYVQRWLQTASQVQPAFIEEENVTILFVLYPWHIMIDLLVMTVLYLLTWFRTGNWWRMGSKLGKWRLTRCSLSNLPVGHGAPPRRISPIKESKKVKKRSSWFQAIHPDINSDMVILVPSIIYLYYLFYFRLTPMMPYIRHQQHTILGLKLEKSAI